MSDDISDIDFANIVAELVDLISDQSLQELIGDWDFGGKAIIIIEKREIYNK